MRTRFRSWDKQNKQMVDDTAHLPDNNYEVMQWIGLKDKNGFEIYEGDILRAIETSTLFSSGETLLDFDFIGVVEYDTGEAGFHVVGKEDVRGFNNGQTYEVLGNVYENPELLKEGE